MSEKRHSIFLIDERVLGSGVALKTHSRFYWRLIGKSDRTSSSGAMSWRMEAQGLSPHSSELRSWNQIISHIAAESRVCEVQDHHEFNLAAGQWWWSLDPPAGATLFNVY